MRNIVAGSFTYWVPLGTLLGIAEDPLYKSFYIHSLVFPPPPPPSKLPNWLSYVFHHISILRQRMVMNFHPRRGGLYVFSSIYKKVMKLFIHPYEGYGVAFKPLNRRLGLVTKLNPALKLFPITSVLWLVT